jgi:hypothetical protein
LQLLSSVSQISGVAAQLGFPLTIVLHTPAGNAHVQAPAEQLAVTCEVHSGEVAAGLTPQTCEGDSAGTFSSICPLQLSS